MPRDSWTKRLDDRVLGPTGILVFLSVVTVLFALAAIFSSFDGDAWVGAGFYGVLALLSFQATRTQLRRRQRNQ